jgi:hypothetical protein
MRFWGKRTFLEPHIEEWHRDCWRWMRGHLALPEAPFPQGVILPNRDFFEPIEGTGHARAEGVLAQVKGLMGLEQWPCTLVERQRVNVELADFMITQPTGKMAAGTFEVEGGEVYITYDPDLVGRPYNLVATFAHELAHYVLHSLPDLPPGAEEEPQIEELATELAVTGFGFGVIAANAAFGHEVSSTMQRIGASGYFSEDQWLFALAVQLRLCEEDPAPARGYLKPHLARKLDGALKRLDAKPDFLAPLRETPA